MTVQGQLARYYTTCNNLLEIFCKKQGFSMTSTYWVGGQPGYVADCARFCFPMDDIITDLEEDAPPGKILEWYNQLEELDYKVSYRHWLHGCPYPTKPTLEELHRRAMQKKKELEREIEEWE